jgi:hypothetical protein
VNTLPADTVSIVINGERHDAANVTLDADRGRLTADINLHHLLGQEVTYLIDRPPGYGGEAIVHAVGASGHERITTTLLLNGPTYRWRG